MQFIFSFNKNNNNNNQKNKKKAVRPLMNWYGAGSGRNAITAQHY